MKKRIIPVVVILIVAALLGYQYLQSKSSNNRTIIRISGNIEITDTELSFMVAGRVEKRLVSEGDTLGAGQLVALLEDTQFAQEVAMREAEVQAAQAALAELKAGSRPEEVAQARASVEKARARLKELRSGSRPQEVAAAEANVDRAQVEAERLRKEYERQLLLYEKEVISLREFEAAQASYEAARARYRESKEHLKLVKEGPRKEQIIQAGQSLKEAEERLALIRHGPRQETIEQAGARLKQAEEALALAKTQMAYTQLTSPSFGVVLSEAIEPGEYVSPGSPVVTIGDLSKVWLRAYIMETDLGRVKLGQKVRVITDTYPDKAYLGQISYISPQAEFTPKNVQTKKERVKLVYRIKVDIPNPEMELKPGMPVEAEIVLNDRES